MISYELGLLDPSFSLLVPTISVTFSYATVAFVGTFVVYVWSFTAVCSCPFTAVCRLPSTFALMAFVMIWHSLLLWQLGVKVLKLRIFPANLVCLGFNCPPFSFKELFFLPHLSLVTSEIVIGSIVLKMVLFEAEAKMFIVSRLDGVNYLTSLTMEGFIPPLYCFEEECQFEEVFLFDCPLSETTVVEFVISPLSLSFYLSTCCLSFLISLSSVLVYALVCLAPCSLIVSSIDGVLVPIGFSTEEIETVVLVDVLRRAGAEVTLVFVEQKLEVEGSPGTKLLADVLISKCSEQVFDLVPLPGGMSGAVRLRDCVTLEKIMKRQAEDKRLYRAISKAQAITIFPWGLLTRKNTIGHSAFFGKLPTFWAGSLQLAVDQALCSEEVEVVTVADVLRRAKVDVTVASVERSLRITASLGTKIVTDKLINEAAESSYDLIILPVRH
ncbi:hypothetical protein IGI04_013742 [Brassica rapa subsp. trilocularis]|uniref:DJ-1/PfpI domain-containing protein n=1 Tax=Brassica rapa subsp. trilocularis TaxID=1813537 RepID=A0ABQ7NAC8_BRACM|nr:hypothetical protein IGI04_013742 [Brassica rapa subsp. trilocularis]